MKMSLRRGQQVLVDGINADRVNRLGRRVLFCIVAVVLCQGAWSSTAHAQTTLDAGAFRVQFWDQADGDANVLIDTISQADLGTWSAAEQQAVIRAFEYWTNTLGLPTTPAANAPIIRVAKDESQTSLNAFSTTPVLNTSATPGFGGAVMDKTNTYSRLVEGTSPARTDGIDGAIVFEPGQMGGSVNTYNTDRITQLATEDFSLELIAIHEVGHTLGWNDSHEPYSQFLNTGTSPFEFTGANAIATYGANLPISIDGSHALLQYHNLTRATPFGDDFRNIPYFAPAELAVYADMGYTGLNLGNQFGNAFYQDGTATPENIAAGFTSTQDYAVGLFVAADNRDITQTGDITISGFAGAGIRISSTDAATSGNTITIASGTTLNVSGQSGVGILASSGAANHLVHRGTIMADGTSGIGMQFDFGPPITLGSATYQIDSTYYGDYLVDQIDITGSISADGGAGNVIQIGDTAAVREFNVMAGASLSGNIVSNALVSTGDGLERPTITFGRTADANGQATSTADAAFTMNYTGDISGSTPVNLDLFGGQLTLAGTVTSQDFTVRDGQLTISGTTTVMDTLDVQAGTTIVNGTLNSDLFTVALGSTLQGSGDIQVTDQLALSGTIAPGNSIGTMTVQGDYVQNSGSTYDVEINDAGQSDLIDVTGAATINGGTLAVDAATGTYQPGQTFTVLTATNGVTGAYSSLTDNLANFDVRQLIESNAILLQLLRPPSVFASIAGTVNQRAVADAIGRLDGTATGDLAFVFDELGTFSDDELRNALDQIGGSLYGSNTGTLILGGYYSMLSVATHLHQRGQFRPALGIHSADVGSRSGYQLVAAGSDNTVRAQSPDYAESEFVYAPVRPGYSTVANSQQWLAWAEGFGLTGDAHSNGNAAGMNYSLGATNFGFDRRAGEDTIVGLNGNYTYSRSSSFDDRITADQYRFGMYASHALPELWNAAPYVMGAMLYGYHDIQSTRSLNFGGVIRGASANYHADEFNAYIESGFFTQIWGIDVQPFLSLQYVALSQDSFTETGAGSLNLTVDDSTEEALYFSVGGRISREVVTQHWGWFAPELHARWVHDSRQDDRSVSAIVGGTAPSGQFQTFGVRFGGDILVVGAALPMTLAPDLNASPYYEVQIASRNITHAGGVQFLW